MKNVPYSFLALNGMVDILAYIFIGVC